MAYSLINSTQNLNSNVDQSINSTTPPEIVSLLEPYKSEKLVNDQGLLYIKNIPVPDSYNIHTQLCNYLQLNPEEFYTSENLMIILTSFDQVLLKMLAYDCKIFNHDVINYIISTFLSQEIEFKIIKRIIENSCSDVSNPTEQELLKLENQLQLGLSSSDMKNYIMFILTSCSQRTLPTDKFEVCRLQFTPELINLIKLYMTKFTETKCVIHDLFSYLGYVDIFKFDKLSQFILDSYNYYQINLTQKYIQLNTHIKKIKTGYANPSNFKQIHNSPDFYNVDNLISKMYQFDLSSRPSISNGNPPSNVNRKRPLNVNDKPHSNVKRPSYVNNKPPSNVNDKPPSNVNRMHTSPENGRVCVSCSRVHHSEKDGIKGGGIPYQSDNGWGSIMEIIGGKNEDDNFPGYYEMIAEMNNIRNNHQ